MNPKLLIDFRHWAESLGSSSVNFKERNYYRLLICSVLVLVALVVVVVWEFKAPRVVTKTIAVRFFA